jgi:L-amino acid N-acyltransferase YncA
VTPASTTSQSPTTRAARASDAPAIAAIHNQGIEERVATFETDPRRPEEVAARIEAGELILVAEHYGEVLGFVSVSPYSGRPAYAGVGEFTVYVERGARRLGVGGALMDAVAEAAEQRGLHKLTSRVFTTNSPSIQLLHARGYRDVGVHRRHAKLDGEWRDVLQIERLLGAAARDQRRPAAAS